MDGIIAIDWFQTLFRDKELFKDIFIVYLLNTLYFIIYRQNIPKSDINNLLFNF